MVPTPPPAPGTPPINQAGFEFELTAALAQAMCLKPDYVALLERAGR